MDIFVRFIAWKLYYNKQWVDIALTDRTRCDVNVDIDRALNAILIFYLYSRVNLLRDNDS